MKAVYYGLFMLMLLSGCVNKPEQLTLEEMRLVVDQFHQVYETSVPDKDLESIMLLYEENAIHMPIQNTILQGKTEISEAWLRTFSLPVISFDLEIIDISGSGEFIHEVGRTHSVFDIDSQQVPAEFKYLNVYRKQADGGYKMHRSIYNQWIEANQ